MVSTDELSGEYSQNLRVFTPSGVQNVNPDNTTTPLQDAVDLAQAENGGHIQLPPGTIQEAATVTIYRNVSVVGHGLGDAALTGAEGLSIVEWPAGVNHMVIDVQAELDGFVLRGGGPTTSAITSIQLGKTGADPRNLQFGALGWDSFKGRAMAHGSGATFQSHLGDFLNVWDVDAGEEHAVFDLSYGFNNTIGHSAVYPTDEGTGSNSTAFDLSDFGAAMQSVNVGGTCNKLLNVRTQKNPVVLFQSNFEPVLNSGSVGSVFDLESGPVTILGTQITTTDSFSTVGQVYNVSWNARKQILTKPSIVANTSGLTTNTNIVQINQEPSEPCWYFGPTSDITNNAGTTTGLVRSLASAGTGNG